MHDKLASLNNGVYFFGGHEMSNAVPAAVMEVHGDSGTATVGFAGATEQVSVELLDTVAVGDYVLVDVGFAVAKISAKEADSTLATIAGGGRDDAGESLVA